MDDLAPLFQDIAFNERFRGYDVAEVDAYIDRVAKAAALVQGRIAELQRRVEAAEAHTTGLSGADPVEAGEESLTKMLVLAQRTADAAIEEAQAEAAEIRRQADDHASLVVAEAETDRRRMLAEAEAAVEEGRSTAVHQQVGVEVELFAERPPGGGEHGEAGVLDLGFAEPRERLRAAGLRQTKRVEEADRRGDPLHVRDRRTHGRRRRQTVAKKVGAWLTLTMHRVAARAAPKRKPPLPPPLPNQMQLGWRRNWSTSA